MRISDWSSDVCSSDLFARIAFGIFVGQLRILRFHHRRAAAVFRRDQFDMRFLTTRLLLPGGVPFGVEVSETRGAFKHGRSSLKRSGGTSGLGFWPPPPGLGSAERVRLRRAPVGHPVASPPIVRL